MRRSTTGLLEAASKKHMSHAILLTFGEESVFGVPLLIRAILVIPIVTSILSVVTLALTLVAWVRGHGAFVGRLYYSLFALASVLFAVCGLLEHVGLEIPKGGDHEAMASL